MNIVGQNTDNKTHNEQVTIVSSFDPSINQAYKINKSPDEVKFDIESPEFEFKALNISFPTEIKLKPITPIVIRADKKTTSYNNLLKIGVGSLFSPYVDFYHSSGTKGDNNLDLHLYQLSTFKNIKDYSPSPEVEALANIGYTKFFRYHILETNLSYQLHSVRYYGFKPDDFPTFSPSDNKLKQTFNTVDLKLNLKSNYKSDKKLSHRFTLGAYYLFDKYNTSETHANFEFDLHKSFEVTDLIDYQNLGILANVEYYGNKDTVTTTDILVEATPYFTGKYGIVNFDIGLNFNYLNSSSSGFYFYPILKASLSMIPDYLTLFAGVDGNVEKNSYRNLSDENPWIQSIIKTEWQRHWNVYGGISGNISQKVNFSTQVFWKSFKNMAFFINTNDAGIATQPLNKFYALYDNGNVFGGNVELTLSASKMVNIFTGFTYNSYSLDSLPFAYQKPTTEFKLGAEVKITEKITAWGEVFYYGARKAYDTSSLADVDLDGFIDLNIGVEYRLTDKLSVWLSGNNLLNSQYQRYLNYPVNGIQVMGGITYRF